MDSLKHWILHEAGIATLEIALVALFAVSLAHWTWVAVSPRVAAATALAARAEPQGQGPLVKRHLFGVALEGAPTQASDVAPGAGLSLLGVFARGDPGAGRAILAREGARAAMVAAGEAIADGLVLREVHPDHVIVVRNGVPERVDLQRGVARTQVRPATRQPVPR